MERGRALISRVFALRIGRLLPRRRRDFLRDESGVTVIEFGLLAVPFFSILAAIMETSVVFLSGQVMDSAVQDVSRLIRTGRVQDANMTSAQFKSLVCDRVFGLLRDCTVGDNLHVEIQVIDRFTEVNIAPPVKWTCGPTETPANCNQWTRPELFTPGVGASIVTVQVYYKWPVIVPFGGLGLSNLPDGRRLMGSATVFRNEPFT